MQASQGHRIKGLGHRRESVKKLISSKFGKIVQPEARNFRPSVCRSVSQSEIMSDSQK